MKDIAKPTSVWSPELFPDEDHVLPPLVLCASRKEPYSLGRYWKVLYYWEPASTGYICDIWNGLYDESVRRYKRIAGWEISL